MQHRLLILLIIPALFLSCQSKEQESLPFEGEIDQLFIDWNQANHPGGSIAVVKDGVTILSKAYGLASLEYQVPNTTNTLFNIASASKQFTAMGIVRLAEQGKLSFDDPIHQYIPELPDFGKSITIRQMLHHTSGLRSFHYLLTLAGWKLEELRTNADLFRYMLHQDDLNFEPGTEFLYCNTGYMLMVNVIENITGEPFKEWMQGNIYEPLGMEDTYVEDHNNNIVLNRATSYYGQGSFERAVEYWAYNGSGNMYSTTNDLLKWLVNFSQPKTGWEASFETLVELDTLKDGTLNTYAFGVYNDQHLGKQRIAHGGSTGGYRSYIVSYPSEKLSIVLLTNFSASDPMIKGEQIAEILLGKPKKELKSNESINTIALSNESKSAIVGSYWNDRGKYSRRVTLENDTLKYAFSENRKVALVPIKKNTFNAFMSNKVISLSFDSINGQQQLIAEEAGRSTETFNYKENTPITKEELASYSGSYYSRELNTSYTVSIKGDQIILDRPRHESISLERLFPDILAGNLVVNTIQFKRDANNQISGILISNERVRNAWFEKQ